MSSGFGFELAEKLRSIVKNDAFFINQERLTDKEAEEIISKIINANFVICLGKYLREEPWRLDGSQPTTNND